MAIKKTSHARYELWYHFAWGTKYRKKIFKEEYVKGYTKWLFREIAGQYDIEVREIEVMSDHIHMLASAPPRISPSVTMASTRTPRVTLVPCCPPTPMVATLCRTPLPALTPSPPMLAPPPTRAKSVSWLSWTPRAPTLVTRSTAGVRMWKFSC